MNYIKQLQETLETTSHQKRELKRIISELRSYVQSNKFHSGNELDNYVSCQDVLNRTEDYLNY